MKIQTYCTNTCRKGWLCSLYYVEQNPHKVFCVMGFMLWLQNQLTEEKQEETWAIFLDFAKTFDTVNHDILLRKLEHYGIRGEPLEWFKPYLDNREQRVHTSDSSSKCSDTTCGVQQGSVYHFIYLQMTHVYFTLTKTWKNWKQMSR